jgi:iron-sulfur cluster assembly accessory protein
LDTTLTDAPAPVTSLPASIILSATAASKVAELLEREANPDYFLRVAVQPGGCSGLRYQLFFDDQPLEGDNIVTEGNVQVRVDRMSAPYLKGASVDWLEGLEQSGFTINNPNAAGSCACGDSFH